MTDLPLQAIVHPRRKLTWSYKYDQRSVDRTNAIMMACLGVTAIMLGGMTWMMTQNSIDLTKRIRAMDQCIVRSQDAYIAQDYGATLAWTVEARKARVTGVCRDSGLALAYLNGK